MESLILVYDGQSEFVAKPPNHKEAVECAIELFGLDCRPEEVGLFIEVKGRQAHVGERGYQALPSEQDVFVVISDPAPDASKRILRRRSRSSSLSRNNTRDSQRSFTTLFDRVQPEPSMETLRSPTTLEPASPAPRRVPSASQLLAFTESPDNSDSSIQLSALPSPPLTPPSSASSASSQTGGGSTKTRRRRSVRFNEASLVSQHQSRPSPKPIGHQYNTFPAPSSESYGPVKRRQSVDGLVLHPPLLPDYFNLTQPDSQRHRKRSSSVGESTRDQSQLPRRPYRSATQPIAAALGVHMRPDSPMPMSRTSSH